MPQSASVHAGGWAVLDSNQRPLRGFCELFGESEGVCAICCGWMWVGIGWRGEFGVCFEFKWGVGSEFSFCSREFSICSMGVG